MSEVTKNDKKELRRRNKKVDESEGKKTEKETKKSKNRNSGDEEEKIVHDEDEPAEHHSSSKPKKTKRKKNKSGELQSEAQEVAEAMRRSGVIYLSTVPPFMKIQKLRHIFSEFGEVRRMYFTPERPALRKAR